MAALYLRGEFEQQIVSGKCFNFLVAVMSMSCFREPVSIQTLQAHFGIVSLSLNYICQNKHRNRAQTLF